MAADLRKRLDHETKRAQKLEEDLQASRKGAAELRAQLVQAEKRCCG